MYNQATRSPDSGRTSFLISLTSVLLVVTLSVTAERAAAQQENVPEQNAQVIENAFSVLHEADVRRELEISDEQYQEIVTFLEKHRRALLVLRIQEQRAQGFEEQLDLVRSEKNEEVKKARESLGKTLLEGQVKRLIELGRQKSASVFAASGGLLKSDLAKKFEITDEQMKKLEKLELESERKLKAIQKKHVESIDQFLAERDKEISKILGEKQSREFKEYFGKPFFLYVERFISLRSWTARENSRNMKPTKKKSGTGKYKRRNSKN